MNGNEKKNSDSSELHSEEMEEAQGHDKEENCDKRDQKSDD